jgi:hypothetical protein
MWDFYYTCIVDQETVNCVLVQLFYCTCTVDQETINCGLTQLQCGRHCSAWGGVFLCCVFGQELLLGALSSLPKAVRSSLVAGLNVVGSGCQSRPKTIPKHVNSVESYCRHKHIALWVLSTLSKHVGVDTNTLHCGWYCWQRLLSLWTTL